ncbi:hypothetical protein ACQPZX_35655 [Actinoplanes sp. CA-142083]|uniref:hypothetical protein n=1 Tax=Actinoplanes sp. CA-142083 TaxID=3239903 RepID=UPI003D8E136B
MAGDETPDPFAQLADWAAQTERRERRKRRWSKVGRTAPWVLTAGVLAVLLALAVPRMFSAKPGVADDAYPKAVVPSGITVTTSESATPTDPFAGTPAATYPKGAAGITLPRAAAVTGFSAAEVDKDLKQVRQALIVGRLDDMMLIRHDPKRLIALLAPNQRKPAAGWFTSRKFSGVATWIDPSVKLDPREDPRVKGRVTYGSAMVDGLRTLRVTTNFIFVYAFAGPDHPLAAVHTEIVWEFPSNKSGMWAGDSTSYSAWVDCTAANRGLLAPTRPEAAPRPSDSEDPNALLEADHSLDIKDEC